MQTQPNDSKETNGINRKQLKEVLTRWEGAVNACERDGDDSDTAVKELTDSRAALLDLLQEAKLVLDNPNSPRWQHIAGKALKDWATAIMETRGVTRAVARENILNMIAAWTTVEISKAAGVIPETSSITMCSADIGKVSPVLLDHLPEGSH